MNGPSFLTPWFLSLSLSPAPGHHMPLVTACGSHRRRDPGVQRQPRQNHNLLWDQEGSQWTFPECIHQTGRDWCHLLKAYLLKKNDYCNVLCFHPSTNQTKDLQKQACSDFGKSCCEFLFSDFLFVCVRVPSLSTVTYLRNSESWHWRASGTEPLRFWWPQTLQPVG